ncbi:MAG TPA: hypothetical protein DCQ98_00470 [Planctomycetaceae bacterium]|nr:hypothetical protein [Planctomycetaceae bacterium]
MSANGRRTDTCDDTRVRRQAATTPRRDLPRGGGMTETNGICTKVRSDRFGLGPSSSVRRRAEDRNEAPRKNARRRH